jgi:hypothetical protein
MIIQLIKKDDYNVVWSKNDNFQPHSPFIISFVLLVSYYY